MIAALGCALFLAGCWLLAQVAVWLPALVVVLLGIVAPLVRQARQVSRRRQGHPARGQLAIDPERV